MLGSTAQIQAAEVLMMAAEQIAACTSMAAVWCNTRACTYDNVLEGPLTMVVSSTRPGFVRSVWIPYRCQYHAARHGGKVQSPERKQLVTARLF